MNRTALFLFILLLPSGLLAGEQIAGKNSYILNQNTWAAGSSVFWNQDNQGTFEVSSGPIDDGPVRCIGSGFSDINGSRGEGICIYGYGADTFTWAWQAHQEGPNTWQVIGSTGKYIGMTGEGTATTIVDSIYRSIPHRVTSWEGVIDLPN
jgi:hypothetical protein